VPHCGWGDRHAVTDLDRGASRSVKLRVRGMVVGTIWLAALGRPEVAARMAAGTTAPVGEVKSGGRFWLQLRWLRPEAGITLGWRQQT
jgi:hypothetical protein